MMWIERRRAGRALLLVAGALIATVAARPVGAQEPPGRDPRSQCSGCHAKAHDLVLGRNAPAERCVGCHEKVHPEFKAIEGLYSGDRVSPVRPDPMFSARVDCADCHIDSTLALKDGARVAALDRVCTSCHGKRFTGMLARWSAGMHWRIEAVDTYVEQACADRRLDANATSRKRLDEARRNIAIVKAGGGLHNVRGADALLRDAVDAAMIAYTAARVEAPTAPALGPDAAGVSCVGCHYGIETAKDTAFGKPFDHGSHALRAGIACTRCHSDANFLIDAKSDVDIKKRQIDPRHGKTTINAASCNECHHAPTTTATCTSCHRSDNLARALRVTLPLSLKPKTAPKSRVVTFDHVDHAKTDCTTCHTSRTAVRTVASCSSCHDTHHTEAKQCAKCHGDQTLAAHKQQDHFVCSSCHAKETVTTLLPDRSFCVSCHAKQADHKPDRQCATCHMQSSPADLRKRIAAGGR